MGLQRATPALPPRRSSAGWRLPAVLAASRPRVHPPSTSGAGVHQRRSGEGGDRWPASAGLWTATRAWPRRPAARAMRRMRRHSSNLICDIFFVQGSPLRSRGHARAGDRGGSAGPPGNGDLSTDRVPTEQSRTSPEHGQQSRAVHE
jgi:hypothetical protein